MKKRGTELSGRFSSSADEALDLALSQFATNGLISARHDAASPFIAVDNEKRIPLAMFKNSSVTLHNDDSRDMYHPRKTLRRRN